MLTATLINSLCPDALPDYVEAFASPEAANIFAEWGISSSPQRLAACMANVCHETGGLTIVRENMNYSKANLLKTFKKRYGGNPALAAAHAGKPVLVANFNYGFRLGNEDNGLNDDDGFRYRGGGPLQATGKGFYRYLEQKSGVAFGSNPELIAVSAHWPLVTAITFAAHPSAKNLCVFADEGNFLACCKGINAGSPFADFTPNGMDDRSAWHRRWCLALGIPSSVKPAGVYRYGSPKSPAVELIQARLNALRYAEGDLTVDGNFGSRTRSAVMDFQAENDIEPVDGVVGPATWAELMAKDARAWPAPASAMMGLAGLRAAGDAEIKAADRDRAAAVALGVTGSAGAATSLGLLDGLTTMAGDASTLQMAITGLLAAVKFGSANLAWIGAIVGAVLLWRRYGAVVTKKVERWTRPVGSDAP